VTLAAVAAGIVLAAGAGAQSVDVLKGSAPTFIYVEADATDNDARSDCDWYRSASELIDQAVYPQPRPGCRVSVRIRGTINRDGAYLFSSLVRRMAELELRPGAIVLDSRGGDADAAISMATQVRQSPVFAGVETRVAEGFDSVCFSACVVIFAAGYRRSLEFDIGGNALLPSRIGIHGPGQFDPDAARYDTSSANAEIRRVSLRLKAFFAGIGVSERLVDDMYAVPFDEIRLLSRDELVSYGLYGD